MFLVNYCNELSRDVSMYWIGCFVWFLQQSKFITAKEGKERGLIDALCSPDELIKMSRLWALEIANCQKPWIRSLGRTDRLGSLSEARSVLSAARQQAKKVAPNMPQHQACLDVIEEGVLYGGHAGVLKVCTCTCTCLLKIGNWGKIMYYFQLLLVIELVYMSIWQ